MPPNHSPEFWLRQIANALGAGGETIPDSTVSGGATVSLGTRLAGEDITTDVMKVEQQFNYMAPISTAATTLVKSGAGFIHQLRVAGGTLGAITVYDSLTASGNIIIPTVTPTQAGLLIEDVKFSTGLTIVTAAATVVVGSVR
jgi:hypothetical protein